MQALRAATTGYFSGDIAIVDGYYTPYDKGGGTYVWDGNSTTTPNDGTVVAPNNKYSGGSGYNVSSRWFLIHNGVVNVRQFGALGDASGDTIADNPYSRFEDTDELRCQTPLSRAAWNALSGLTEDDTIDWCAIRRPHMVRRERGSVRGAGRRLQSGPSRLARRRRLCGYRRSRGQSCGCHGADLCRADRKLSPASGRRSRKHSIDR